MFSLHDNRNSFMSDAQYFEQGLGKKRSPTKSSTYNPDFVAWMPFKKEVGRPLKSTYQVDFSKYGAKQILVKRPKTSFEGGPTTTYRYAHCDVGPNTQEIAELSQRAVDLTTFTRLQRSKTARPMLRETVASCLSWYRPHVPAATDVTDYSNNSCHQFAPNPPATAPPILQQHVEVLSPQPPAVPKQMAAE